MSNGLNFVASLEIGVAACAEACKLAERKLEELKRKISGYQWLAESVEALLDSPCRRKANADCSLVAAQKTHPAKLRFRQREDAPIVPSACVVPPPA